MCTYCSGINGLILTAIRYAWKGQPFDKVEVLTGKAMKPTPGMNKTILLGKCMYQANKDNPDIKEMIAVKGCPPKPDDVVNAFHQAGIPIDKNMFDNMDQLPAFFMAKYQGKPEFDEAFFRVSGQDNIPAGSHQEYFYRRPLIRQLNLCHSPCYCRYHRKGCSPPLSTWQ